MSAHTDALRRFLDTANEDAAETMADAARRKRAELCAALVAAGGATPNDVALAGLRDETPNPYGVVISTPSSRAALLLNRTRVGWILTELERADHGGELPVDVGLEMFESVAPERVTHYALELAWTEHPAARVLALRARRLKDATDPQTEAANRWPALATLAGSRLV